MVLHSRGDHPPPRQREISTLEKEFFETTSCAFTSITHLLKPHRCFPWVVFGFRGGRVEKGNSRCYLRKPIISGYFFVLSRDHLKYQPYFYSKHFFRCSATTHYRYNAADVFLENAGKSYIFGEIDVCDPFLQKIKIYEYFCIFTVSQVL